MAVNTIAASKNTGLSEKDIVYPAFKNGMTDSQGQAEARAARNRRSTPTPVFHHSRTQSALIDSR